MTAALQVPTWPNPVGTVDLTNVYAIVTGFKIEAHEQRYFVEVSVYLNQAAHDAAKRPIATIVYRCQIGSQAEGWDGVFPNWATAFADPNFQTPLLALRDWIFDTMIANDARFTGSTEL